MAINIKWDYITAPGTHIVQTKIIKYTYLQCYGGLLDVCTCEHVHVLYLYVCAVYVTCFASIANDYNRTIISTKNK